MVTNWNHGTQYLKKYHSITITFMVMYILLLISKYEPSEAKHEAQEKEEDTSLLSEHE